MAKTIIPNQKTSQELIIAKKMAQTLEDIIANAADAVAPISKIKEKELTTAEAKKAYAEIKDMKSRIAFLQKHGKALHKGR